MTAKTFNVLIIDDQREEHDLYEEFLRDDDNTVYQFYHAYNGADGEKIYREHAIDCVLLDYRLPDSDGLEILKRLTRGGKVVPVIMLTGEGSEAVAVTAMKLGSQDYLPKRTVTANALRRTVARAAERAEILQQMETYREELARSNRDLEQFANVIAHDLKAPLRAVTQHLGIIKSKCAPQMDEKSMRSLHFAVSGAEHMRSLIEAVFEYSKLGFREQHFTAVDCNAILEMVKHNLSTAIEETGAIIHYEKLPTVEGDPIQLLQLFQNLIANAMTFCKTQPRIEISAVEESGRIKFSVKDNGIGIAPEHSERIFVLFRRIHTEAEYAGTGVGLAICERVAKNHKGRIWIESVVGSGTTFHFTLPMHEESLLERRKYA